MLRWCSESCGFVGFRVSGCLPAAFLNFLLVREEQEQVPAVPDGQRSAASQQEAGVA